MGSCLSSTLVYADTGEGKTWLVGSFAKMVKKKTGKKTMIITREPGGLDTILPFIDAGMVDVWDIATRNSPAETLDFASRGYLPDPKDPQKLIAPSQLTWDTYGGFAFEGGTSFGEYLMEELTELGALNQISGVEKAPQQFTSGQLRIAGANMSFYGIVQSRLRRAINASQKLPLHIMWTCRELKAQDEEMVSGFKEIYGPQLIGQALTPHVPSWFGRTIHLDIVQAKDGPERRAFFKTHFYPGSKTPYVANPRLPAIVADELPESIVVAKDGSTMIWLDEKLTELREKARKLLG